ncbi:IgaA/UmoB family intracellular growth attenuator [Pragia fontium]|uniref:Intracellular growth attenuator protein IgaA n=2 Tax=Pragia fontium TaxID=82985 RepID=A0AAJ4WCM8_9GAMM|nr:IgaA/UmoB family intracellular growth attenuator [Pragia fontium]GKX64570.1 intracellular growth attenuator protein IgaA [Pragia fontium]SFD24792.1 Intracellular growth attenuator protein IgaA [Pragia fontium DSM 5563 = ATCC 49100]VEJ53010.1 Intracellular growth attenuator protein igaA [Pragia fontium]
MLSNDDVSVLTILLLIIFIALAGVGLALWIIRHRKKNNASLENHLPFVHNSTRKLSTEETLAINEYLELLEKQHKEVDQSSNTSIKSSLTPYSDNVYSFQSAIITLNSPDNTNVQRYYIDGIEVYLEAEWIEYLSDINQVDVVKTQTIPLVVELNGHKLTEFVLSKRPHQFVDSQPAQTESQENDDNVELIRLRKETTAEYNLKPKKKLYESLIISASYAIFFFSLVSSAELLPWFVILGGLLLGFGIWRMLRPDPKKTQYNIHCLRGVPKRWGLFGESDNGQLTNISVGTIDLIYPPHWQPYVGYDLDHKTNIDIYLNRYVVKQGKFLSLHNESVNFPLHHWGKNLVLALSSLLVVTLIISFIPLKLPLELTKAWLHGSSNINVTSPEQLKRAKIKVGDHLTVRGMGMCSIPTIYRSDIDYPFMPFDCTEMYWGVTNLPSLPPSEVIDNGIALLNTMNYQLNPMNNQAVKNNPELARTAERAGMTLVPDFSDIVLKTENLCKDPGDCRRLKNSLMILSNEKDWDDLVAKSQVHATKDTDVFLRPVAADTLRSQVNSIVSSFFYSQTHQAAQALYIKPKGGFYIRNDDDEKQMVDNSEIQELTHPTIPLDTLYDNTAIKQWFELQRLSNKLLDTQFSTSGIVLEVTPIENGTTKISLHSESNIISFWRYLGASLLFVIMLASLLYNLLLLIIRMRKNAHRISKIQDYYDRCFAKSLRLKVQQS